MVSIGAFTIILLQAEACAGITFTGAFTLTLSGPIIEPLVNTAPCGITLATINIRANAINGQPSPTGPGVGGQPAALPRARNLLKGAVYRHVHGDQHLTASFISAQGFPIPLTNPRLQSLGKALESTQSVDFSASG